MQSLDMTDEEIRQFADAQHWLDYFPPRAVADLRSIGIHVSLRNIFNYYFFFLPSNAYLIVRVFR